MILRVRNGVRFAVSLLCGGYLLALSIQTVFRPVFGDRVNWLALVNALTPFLYLPLLIVLPLSLLLRLRWLAVIAGALTLLALIQFGPRFLPRLSSTANAQGQEIRVISFNLYRLNTDIDAVVKWLQDEDADLVLLQEFPRAGGVNMLTKLAALYPYVFGDGVSYSGSVALSKFPITEASSFGLVDWSHLQQRFLITVNGRAIVVYNIHLTNPIIEGRDSTVDRRLPQVVQLFLNYDETIRNYEIDLLNKYLKSEQQAVIVAGDFNMSDHSAMYTSLSDLLHDSFAEKGQGFGTTWPALDTNGLPAFVPPLLRLDYIWHTGELITVAAQLGPRLGSDHLPVEATLAVG